MNIEDSAQQLSDQLDRDCIPLTEQAPMCLSVGIAAIAAMTREEQIRHLAAHLAGLSTTLDRRVVIRALRAARLVGALSDA